MAPSPAPTSNTSAGEGPPPQDVSPALPFGITRGDEGVSRIDERAVALFVSAILGLIDDCRVEKWIATARKK